MCAAAISAATHLSWAIIIINNININIIIITLYYPALYNAMNEIKWN